MTLFIENAQKVSVPEINISRTSFPEAGYKDNGFSSE